MMMKSIIMLLKLKACQLPTTKVVGLKSGV